MINKKNYIPLTKNNFRRIKSFQNSQPDTSKTSDDLNNEISIDSIGEQFEYSSFNKSRTKKYKSFKIYNTTREPETTSEFALGTEDLNIVGTESNTGLGVS